MTVENQPVLDDRYVLEEIIGRGGMADVHRATDRLLLRPVALKIVREIAEPGARERFVDEARTLASLNHPGLITLLDAGILNERPYLVMELVSGPTLSARIADGALEPGLVREIGRQLAAALGYAHAQGIVHRDVKPSNVLLCDDERVLLADFGIARLVGSAQHHTRTGGTVGSPAYLAPEQVAGEEVGPSADVFALGLVLLESLTGVRAFTGSAIEAAMARLHAGPSIPDGVDPAWRALITRMTDREPGRRPSSTEVASQLADPLWAQGAVGGDSLEATGVLELTQDLSRTLPPSTSAPAAPLLATSSAESAPGPTPRRRRLVVAAAVLVLAVIVVVLVVTAPWKDRSATDSGGGVPPGVPTRLQQPLSDLHDAVDGHHR